MLEREIQETVEKYPLLEYQELDHSLGKDRGRSDSAEWELKPRSRLAFAKADKNTTCATTTL